MITMSYRRLTLCLAFAPAALGAQSLARRIDDVRDGTVQLTYAARSGLCGDGRDVIRTGAVLVVLPSMFGYGHSDNMEPCFAGPVRVAIGRSHGETVSYRVHVGGRWTAGEDATDLGVVSAPEAARYLLDAATRARGRNTDYALAAAVFADSIDLTPDLIRVARSDVRQDLRSRAVFWIGTYEDPAAARALRELAADTDLDEDVRGAAIIALGRDEMTDDDVAWLRELYPRLSSKLRDNVFLAVSRSESPRASRWLATVTTDANESVHTREQAMFWLGQGRGPTSDLVRLYDRLGEPSLRTHYTFVLSQRHDREALDKLIDVAQHDSDKSVRHQALFWLGQSKDPRALAFIRDLVTR
jgi:HEAT repeat protein